MGQKMEINKVLENYIRQLLGVGKKNHQTKEC